jgi:FlaA1/EpsC-like NDP-sugar epimerase
MLDLVLITVCYYVAYRLRFEGASLDPFLQYFLSTLPIVLGCKLLALLASGLYQRSWDTFGLRDLTTVVRGVGIGSLLTVAASYYLYRGEGSSRVVFVLDALLLGAAISRDARVVPGHEPVGRLSETRRAAECSSTVPAATAVCWCVRCAPTRRGA